MKRQLTLILFLILFVQASYSQTLAPAPYKIMPEQLETFQPESSNTLFRSSACDRYTILSDYTDNYESTSVTDTELAWTGSGPASCDPGTTSTLAKDNTLARINYFRKLCGLADNITFDQASYEVDCQSAALIMDAENQLSHFPPNTWACYSAEGFTGAGGSNIARGVHSADAISLFIDDP